MTRYRRSPRPLSTAIESLSTELSPGTLLAEIQSRWAHAVGEGIAAEATPVSERAGVLTIACSSSLWAHELDLLSTPLIARLNELLEAGAISRFRCVTT